MLYGSGVRFEWSEAWVDYIDKPSKKTPAVGVYEVAHASRGYYRWAVEIWVRAMESLNGLNIHVLTDEL